MAKAVVIIGHTLLLILTLQRCVADDFVPLGRPPINVTNTHKLEYLPPVNSFEFFEKTGGAWLTADHVREFPLQRKAPNSNSILIPKSFDARVRWPNCTIIREIRNQGHCACCWAHAVAGALSDRICISSPNQDLNVRLSSQHLLSCCTTCTPCESNCKKGSVEMAYHHFITDGIVTGGGFNETGEAGGCDPYKYLPIKQKVSSGQDDTHNFPCKKECSEDYSKTFAEDVYKGQEWFMITDVENFNPQETERKMQLEIMTNGSVTVNMRMYDDFADYKQGIYKHNYEPEKTVGFHSMRCIGWGVEGSSREPYWIVANSFGIEWGQNGFGKIRRGFNNVGIEYRVSAGVPIKLKNVRGGGMPVTMELKRKEFTYQKEKACHDNFFLGGGDNEDKQ